MKTFLKIFNIFTWILVIVAVALSAALVGVRLFGYTPYYIESGSMSPAYEVYDLIYVKHIDPEEVQVGDPISYVFDSHLKVVTHRVVEVDRENRCFHTKGDANDTPDGNPVRYENYLGVVKFSIPQLGRLSEFLSTKRGKLIAVAVIATILLLLVVPEIFKSDDKKKKDSSPVKEETASDETDSVN